MWAQWQETVLYQFCYQQTSSGNCEAANPAAGLLFDSQGNLNGTTVNGGTAGHPAGTAFKLSPPGSGGAWTFAALYDFYAWFCHDQTQDCIIDPQWIGTGFPSSGLIFDSSGNWYAVTATTHDSVGTGVVENGNPITSAGSWHAQEIGLTIDSHGNLYSERPARCTSSAGTYGCVYELTPASGGQWTENELYVFTGGADGNYPFSQLIFDSQGNVYGATMFGGSTSGCSGGSDTGCGVVFKLTPPVSGTGPWTESVLYTFSGGSDGGYPEAGVISDSQGNLYGTTYQGGNASACPANSSRSAGCGVVYKLSPPASGSGPWTETVLYAFTGGSDGGFPQAGLAFDSTGNLYGTTTYGGSSTACPATSGTPAGCGVVFEVSPPAGGTGSWTESILHTFTGGSSDGAQPYSNVILDAAGNVYGTTQYGGNSPCSGTPAGCGVVFEISPLATETVLSSSTNPSSYDQSVTFSATVTSSNGVVPTGTVTFKNGSTSLGSAGLNASGVATLSYSALTPGTYSITATYNGSKTLPASTSAALTQSVNKAATSAALTTTPNPSSGAQSVTFSATVSDSIGSTPAGTVTFKSGATAIGSANLAGGTATLKYSGLAAGTHSITATYNGSSLLSSSTSPAVTQTVNSEPTTTTLTSSTNPSASGQTVAFTATVSSGNGATPGGTVSFYNGSTLIGNASLMAGSGGTATAAVSDSTLSVGTHSITAKYTGSNYMSASTSAVLTQTVN